MAYSYNVYTGNGSTTQFTIGFPYIRREHVKVYVASVDTAYTYVTSTIVELATAPGDQVRVEVRRVTPFASALVDFTDGSTLVAADLDTSNLQHLYLEQELDDANKQGIYVDPVSGQLTAGSQQIKNVTNPTAAQDAATKSYVDGVALAGTVPDGDRGDITVSSTGTVWTVDNGLSSSKLAFSNRLTPRKIASKFLTNYNGTTTNLRVCVFGDSLAAEKPKFLIAHLARQLSPVNSYPPGFHSGAPLTGDIGSNYVDPRSDIVTGTFAANSGDGYTYWHTGPLNQLVSGSRIKWVYAGNPGVDPTFTSFTVFYVKEPGAGSFQVLVNNATVQTINASNGSVVLGSYIYTQASAASKFELLNVSGSIRIIGVFNTTTEQGVYATNLALGGLALSNAMSSAQARGLLQSFLAAMNYDVFTWEMDDVTPSDLALLGNVLDAALPVADKIFIASTPQSGIPTSSQRRDDLEAFCLSRGVTYFFFDGWTPVAPYSTLTALGWQGDGVHVATDCQSYLAGLLIRQLGIDGFVYGRSVQPVRTETSQPSQFGRNSVFKGPQPDANISLDTDGSFGYDWTLKFSRTLTFTGNLGGSQVVAQFSRNTGVNPNILPTSWKWDSSSDTRSVAWSSGGGFNIFNFLDSANSVGASPIYVSALHLAAYTSTTLPTSNNRAGSMIYVSNGSSGGAGCLAYSRGEGPTTWRRVVDDTVI